MSNPMMQDKVVVVTGAGGGIGRDIALALAREGARVVVNDIGASLSGEVGNADGAASTGSAQSVVDEITRAGGQAVAKRWPAPTVWPTSLARTASCKPHSMRSAASTAW